MKRLLLYICLLPIGAWGQKIGTIKLQAHQIPPQLKYSGKVKYACQFTDTAGKHLLITTETGEYVSAKTSGNSDGRNAELYAYHYLVERDNRFKLTWKVHDLITDCPVDINMDYIPNTTQNF